jgi:hypothetical protein
MAAVPRTVKLTEPAIHGSSSRARIPIVRMGVESTDGELRGTVSAHDRPPIARQVQCVFSPQPRGRLPGDRDQRRPGDGRCASVAPRRRRCGRSVWLSAMLLGQSSSRYGTDCTLASANSVLETQAYLCLVDNALIDVSQGHPEDKLIGQSRSESRKSLRAFVSREARPRHRPAKKRHLLVCKSRALAIRAKVRDERNECHANERIKHRQTEGGGQSCRIRHVLSRASLPTRASSPVLPIVPSESRLCE